MAQRFKIEDLVYQDASGVIFRAFDSESGQTVALRRFFPHGADGHGLSDDEQIAYAIALDRLIGINHPALRSVVCGGCDPVDGMPFIATQWIDGDSLPLRLESSPPSAAEAADLLGKALEVCQLLSEVMAEEAVWVETELETIVVGTAGSGRGATFWVSPFTWLGGNNRGRGLEPFVALCEEIMGWKGKVISDLDANGLGGWLRWLHGAAGTATLREARETLATCLGVEPPVPARRPDPQAFTPPSAKRRKPSRLPVWSLTSCILFAIGGGTWAWMRKTEKLPAAPSDSTAELMDFDAFKLQSTPSGPPRAAMPAKAKAPAAAENEPRESAVKPAPPGRVFTPLDWELLIEKKGTEVTFEGDLRNIAFSSTGKTMYLLFSETPTAQEPRGAVLLSSAPADLNEAALKPMLGKKVRLLGHVRMEQIPRPGRPVVFITERAAIQVVE